MKKLISLVVCSFVLLSLSVPVFAGAGPIKVSVNQETLNTKPAPLKKSKINKTKRLRKKKTKRASGPSIGSKLSIVFGVFAGIILLGFLWLAFLQNRDHHYAMILPISFIALLSNAGIAIGIGALRRSRGKDKKTKLLAIVGGILSAIVFGAYLILGSMHLNGNL